TEESYALEVTVSDGVTTIRRTISISVNDVNEAPTGIELDSNSINENVAVNTAVGTFTTVDPDTGDSFTYLLAAGAGATDNGAFSIVGDQLQINSSPDFETQSSYSIRVSTTDEGGESYSESFSITVVDLNDNDPMITSDNMESVLENTTAVLTVVATDADANTMIRYSLSGGLDMGKFSINENSGALTFTSAPDFEIPGSVDGNNIYEVEVTASDGLNSDTQTLTVTVTNVDGVQITSEDMKSVAENTAAVLTVTAVTETASGGAITYSFSGGADRSSFSIDQNTGALTFTSAPDFEAKGSADNDNVYEVEVTAGDGDNSITQTITVTVTDVNEAPAFSSGSFTLTIGEDAARRCCGCSYRRGQTFSDFDLFHHLRQ
ncbi:MAG: cadherin repeat domain-containing protein, partial [Ekhidna sp.]|nr:cadherin repeat domain-containing protein [Ekhidna sp.]